MPHAETDKFCRYASQYKFQMLNGVYRIIATEIAPLYPFVKGSNNTVLDVGGNVGNWAKAWMDIFGDVTGKYYLFEPLTVNIDTIETRTKDGFFDDGDLKLSEKMIVMQCAVGNEPGELTINYTAQNTGLSSALHAVSHMPGRSVALTETETAPVITLDAFCAEKKIDHVDILKIDVEGFEKHVLEGAEGLMTHKKVDIILFEFGLHQISCRHFFIDFWKMFEKYGYEVHRFGLGRRGWGLQKFDKYFGGLEEMSSINFFMARLKG